MVSSSEVSIDATVISVGAIINDSFNLIISPDGFQRSIATLQTQTPVVVKYTAENLDIEPSALPEYRNLIERTYDHCKEHKRFRVKLNITPALDPKKVQYEGIGIIEFLSV